MSDDNEQEYCICRSTDIDRFMIMCDHCEEWFHGNCINVTEKQAKMIKFFYCNACCKGDPSLKIKYRKKRTEAEDKEKKHKQKSKKLKSSFDTKSKHNEKAKEHKVHHKEHHHKKPKKDLYRQVDMTKLPSFNQKKYNKEKEIVESKPKSRLRISDEDEDMDIELEKPQPTTPVKQEKQHEKKSMATYDMTPRDYDSTSIQLKSSNKVKTPPPPRATKPKYRCGNCENCQNTEDCGRCDVCHDVEKYGPKKINSEVCRLRRCLYESEEESKVVSKKSKSKNSSHAAMKRQAEADKTYVVEKPPKLSRSTEKKQEKKKKKRKSVKIEPYSGYMMGGNEQVYTGPTSNNQCLGPQCIQAARLNSKYCSDNCGRQLARIRLTTILPQRIQNWNSSPTVADLIGNEDLKLIRANMSDEKKELDRLEEKFRKLEVIISTAKKLTIDDKRNDYDEHDEIDQHITFCVICGQSTSIRNATKHMDRCYNKTEALTSFGSIFPTKIDGIQRLFCDVLNEQQRTYCKRLQVLCPEHTKEPKIHEDEVCGCPINNADMYTDKFDFKPNSFCRLSKKKCNKHFRWETMYRAEVDLQRIRQWLKIDEIFEEERRIKHAMSNRAGVMSLLLHQTTRHDFKCTDMRTKPTVSKKPAYKLMI